ncbi:MAG: DNA translocase FtsK [Eubacterium sp.]|nr:DNA translocase FtsK [Eubacterium sp.]MBQ3413079.1 DNA translocase FtsK [Oscillospiraceae bacterium]
MTYIFSLARPTGNTFIEIVSDLYNMGADKIGTGIISAVLGWPLERWLGSTGAKITISVLFALTLMFITGKTIIDFFMVIWKWILKIRDAIKKAEERRRYEAASRFVEATSLENLRQADDFEEKARRIDIPLEEKGRKKAQDIPLDGNRVGFDPGREKNVSKHMEKKPDFDIDLGPSFDPTAEGVELDPKGPAGTVIKDLFGKDGQPFTVSGTENDPQEIDYPEAGTMFSETERQMREAANNARKVDAEVEKLAREADSEYLRNANAESAVIKERKQPRNYRRPPISLLKRQATGNERSLEAELSKNAERLVGTLESFGVRTRVINISRGPTVTRYELQPEMGVRINRIVSLADDIALNLAAESVRIEAPIPGKSAVGIEIPNAVRQVVNLRSIIESEEFQNSKGMLTFSLGKDVTGAVKVDDIEKMPHLLIAGATGMGKSVCINSIILSLLYKYSPDDLRLILVDPKMVEFGSYNGIPHLYMPVVTDPRKAAGALGWAVSEMLKRYRTFSTNGCRDITSYNAFVERMLKDPDYEPKDGEEELVKLPRVVIIIDELADLMIAAPNEVEEAIQRLAQMARAAGMYLILATQRPSVDVITGVIKNNIPSRIAFAVSSQVDSRTILDTVGADKLLGRGDMLYAPVGTSKMTRIQGSFVTEEEVEAVVNYIKKYNSSEYDDSVIQEVDRLTVREKGKASAADTEDGPGVDDMFEAAVEVVLEAGQASTSMLQRRLRLGYARAARIMDEMEQAGIISPAEGSKPRQIRITKQQWLERVTTKDE